MSQVFLIKAHHIFLVLALGFGLSFIVITPPFQVPDEFAHFFRAYQVSELKFISDKQKASVGAHLPSSLVKVSQDFHKIPFHAEMKTTPNNILSNMKIPLNVRETSFIDFRNTALYSPLLYLPQAIGIMMGRAFDFSPLVLMYVGRLANLLLWIFLIYLSLKIMPTPRWLFLALALMPMSLFQAASLSADAVTNGVCFLFGALVLSYASIDHPVLRFKEILTLILMAVILGFIKPGYALLVLLVLIIPTTAFLTFKRRISFSIGVIFVSFVCSLIWFYRVHDLFIPLRTELNIVPNIQLDHVMTNPIHFLEVLKNEILISYKRYLEEFVGVLGWQDTHLPSYVWKFYLCFLSLIAIFDHSKHVILHWGAKSVFFFILSLTMLVIFLSQYLVYNSIDSDLIEGIQGRYFFAFSFLPFLLFNNQKIKISIEGNFYLKSMIVLCFTVVLIITDYVLIRRYY